MPIAVKNLYDTLNDFYRQQVDDFIVMMVNQQKEFSLENKPMQAVNLDFLVSDSHNSKHFDKPQKWTREELYNRGL